MAKTTVEIDDRLMREVRALSRRENRTLKETLEFLISSGLRAGKGGKKAALRWTTSDSQVLVDILDKDALYRAMESE